MSVIETVSESSGNSPQGALEAALDGIAQTTSFYDFEIAWITGLRTVSGSDGDDARNDVLAAAGERLCALGELQDDVARRGWLRHIAEAVRLRGDGWIGDDLEQVAATEAREAFARITGDLTELREAVASGENLSEFAALRPRPADRIRDLGRIAEGLRGSGLLALCPAEDYGLARDLARAMHAPVHLVPTVPEPLRVSRDDLIGWAQTSEAAAQFPRLMRSLVTETEPSAEWIDMPAGTGTALPGWDGIARCTRGNRFVPLGKSAWEFTTQQDGVKKKADCDYEKRLEDSTADERAEVAYVAAACAPWTKRRDFESERTGEGDFDRVVALNVDNLEDWLSCAIASTVWTRDQLGKPTEGISLLAKWWENWLAQTTTPLDEGLVLAGREKAAAELREHCSHGGGIVTIGGQVHRDEIIAFIAAALNGGDAGATSADHVLYVDSHATAERLFAQEALSIPPGQPSVGLVLTIVVPSPEFARHLPAGSPHRMIVPVPGSTQTNLTLDAVDSELVAKRLEAAEFEMHEAHELGSIARTSLIALQRRLAKNPALHTPEWAAGHIEAPLRGCLLIGGWDGTREGDREVVAQLAGTSYAEATEMLRRLDTADAPLVAVDEQWYGVSPADTWVLLRDQLTPDDIKQFAETALAVLTGADPLRELTGEDLIRARLDGVKARCSLRLKRGIATTLALAGSLPPDSLASALHASDLASRVTSQLFRAAMDDPTHRTWLALVDIVPLLGEAAPDVVLRALRSCLADQHAFTQSMFADSGSSLIDFGPSSPHLRILNALEVMAWSPEHLSAVADVLARLDWLDPGGRFANRPAATLASIMCLWMPYTSADAETRIAAVHMLRRHHPGVAWKLMLSMLPNDYSVQTPGALPQYRNWRPTQPVVRADEPLRLAIAVAEMLIEDVGEDSERWIDLLQQIRKLPNTVLASAVEKLRGITASGPDETFKSTVWPALRKLAERHRQFRDAQWALPESRLEELEQVRDRLRPAEPSVAFGYLFSSGRLYIDGVSAADGYEQFQAVLRPRQAEAVTAILSDGGLAAVLDFAATADDPCRVGTALAAERPTLDADLLQAMEAASEASTLVGLGYFGHRFGSLGWDGMAQLISDHDVSAQVTADLVRSPPPIEMSWTRVNEFGPVVAAEYWNRVSYYDLGYPDDLHELLDLCRRLRAAGRIGLAAQILTFGSNPHMTEAEFAEEAIACLDQWIEEVTADAGDVDLTMHILTTLFEAIDRHREHLGTRRVAMLEWRYRPLLSRDPEFSTPNLYRAMSRDPELFAELVALAFKPASVDRDSEAEPSEAQQQLALNAYEVVSRWPASSFAPGVGDAGGLDSTALNEWIDRAREALAAIDRAAIGDEMIGIALASSPAHPDGDWPGEATRDLLDRLDNDDIDQGLLVAIRSQRDATWRAVSDGGEQERELAERYRADSRRFQGWPRTAAIFNSLAKGYEHEATVHDREAESRRRGL